MPARSSSSAIQDATLRWVLASLAGVAVAVGVVALWPGPPLPPAARALVAMATGWLVVLIAAPWADLHRQLEERRTLRRIAAAVRTIGRGRGDRPSRSILDDQDGELGELCAALRELIAQTVNHRVRATALDRTMNDAIRRETRLATAELQRQASTDALTGLANRRALEQELDRLARAARDAGTSVLALDLDLFKQVNDRLGHDVGDQCLVFLADVLKSSLRRDDLAVRLGGDEFVVLMPDRAPEDARRVAERLSRLFAQMPWPHAGVPAPSLSIGVATVGPGESLEPSALLRQADAALYAAKRAGRSRIAGAPRRGAA